MKTTITTVCRHLDVSVYCMTKPGKRVSKREKVRRKQTRERRPTTEGWISGSIRKKRAKEALPSTLRSTSGTQKGKAVIPDRRGNLNSIPASQDPGISCKCQVRAIFFPGAEVQTSGCHSSEMVLQPHRFGMGFGHSPPTQRTTLHG